MKKFLKIMSKGTFGKSKIQTRERSLNNIKQSENVLIQSLHKSRSLNQNRRVFF